MQCVSHAVLFITHFKSKHRSSLMNLLDLYLCEQMFIIVFIRENFYAPFYANSTLNPIENRPIILHFYALFSSL